MERSAWFIVVSAENWEQGRLPDGRRRFGVTKRYQRLFSSLRARDRVFVYVTGSGVVGEFEVDRLVGWSESVWNDPRFVLQFSMGVHYVGRKPIPFSSIVEALDFVKAPTQFRQYLRSSLRHLGSEDERVLRTALRNQA